MGALAAGMPIDSRTRWTLRRKGIVAFLIVVAYLATIGGLVSHQRLKLNGLVDAFEQLHGTEEALTRVKTSLAHGMLVVHDAWFAGDPSAHEPVLLDLEAIQSGLNGLRPAYPTAASSITAIAGAAEHLRRGADRTRLLDVRTVFHGLMDVLGALGAVFFRRLTTDLHALQGRATQIVDGYRGTPLQLARDDEVGDLALAINRMQTGLREREQQLEIARQQRFHQEKIATVGSLAAAIAHEINNPIAAIHGVAEAVNARCRQSQCDHFGHGCEPGLILEHTQRIAGITRQLSQMSFRQSALVELLDLNALVRSTSNLLSYDKRLRGIGLALDLDTQIPAVEGVPDHLTQVRINLLLNAADALAGVADRPCTITVGTRVRHGAVELVVTDNGCGMTPDARARVRRVLHDQGARCRHRHRPLHLQGAHHRGRRQHRSRIHPQPRHDRHRPAVRRQRCGTRSGDRSKPCTYFSLTTSPRCARSSRSA